MITQFRYDASLNAFFSRTVVAVGPSVVLLPPQAMRMNVSIESCTAAMELGERGDIPSSDFISSIVVVTTVAIVSTFDATLMMFLSLPAAEVANKDFMIQMATNQANMLSSNIPSAPLSEVSIRVSESQAHYFSTVRYDNVEGGFYATQPFLLSGCVALQRPMTESNITVDRSSCGTAVLLVLNDVTLSRVALRFEWNGPSSLHNALWSNHDGLGSNSWNVTALVVVCPGNLAPVILSRLQIVNASVVELSNNTFVSNMNTTSLCSASPVGGPGGVGGGVSLFAGNLSLVNSLVTLRSNLLFGIRGVLSEVEQRVTVSAQMPTAGASGEVTLPYGFMLGCNVMASCESSPPIMATLNNVVRASNLVVSVPSLSRPAGSPIGSSVSPVGWWPVNSSDILQQGYCFIPSITIVKRSMQNGLVKATAAAGYLSASFNAQGATTPSLSFLQVVAQRNAQRLLCAALQANSNAGVSSASSSSGGGGGDGDSPPMSDTVNNPFQLRISMGSAASDDFQFVFGSMVGNLIIFAIVAVVVMLSQLPEAHVEATKRLGKKSKQPVAPVSLQYANVVVSVVLFEGSLPGALCTPFTMILEPLLTSAVAVVTHSTTQGAAGGVVFAAAILIATIVPLLWLTVMIVVVHRRMPLEYERSAVMAPSLKRHYLQDLAVKAIRVLFEPKWELRLSTIGWPESEDDDDDERGSKKDASRATRAAEFGRWFGAVIAPYTKGYHWFFVVEMTVSVGSSVVSGVAMGSTTEATCASSFATICNSILVALSSALLVAGVACRPFATVFDNALLCSAACLTTLSLALILADVDESTVATVSLVQACLGLLPLPLMVVDAVRALQGWSVLRRPLRVHCGSEVGVRVVNLRDFQRNIMQRHMQRDAPVALSDINGASAPPSSPSQQLENLAGLVRMICGNEDSKTVPFQRRLSR